jgi:hypothetical protein
MPNSTIVFGNTFSMLSFSLALDAAVSTTRQTTEKQLIDLLKSAQIIK